jgi:hypothetical protein
MMGIEMRDRYMVKNKLLDELRYNPNQLQVRSTDVNRTIESALS